MKSILNKTIVYLFVLMLGMVMQTFAQTKDKIEGVWYNGEKTAKINIFKATNGKFYGEIIWLKVPNKNGKPKVDENNPDKNKREHPLLKLQVLKGFEKDGEKTYEDGTIYDPKNGKTYSCKITHNGNSLDVRGYVGISLIGRTAVWEKAE
ncbi:MAG TPA: DUF2147 domain-containing protein [Flavipsychrobacter sp.]|nr:DUF2147 domain-containing protein [Flavipsychrobacter sp.]